MPQSDTGGPGRSKAEIQATARSAARRLRTAAVGVRRAALKVAYRDRVLRQRDELRTKLGVLRQENANLRDLRREDRTRLASMVAELHRLRGEAVPQPELTSGLRHLFIVTYGRSGSTLLQGVLCSQPGFLIQGENGGVLERLFQFHQRAMHERKVHLGPVPLSSRSPWHGIDGYPPELALENMRRLVTETLLRPLPETRVVGFKEIRWPEDDLPKFFDFMLELFPDARFVVNTRDLDSVVKSGWWVKMPEARNMVQDAEKRILAAAEALGDRAYLVHYDDYVADPSSFEGLFTWLGEEFDLERIKLVISRRHSYDPARATA